jgi:hypothetical protein
MNLLVIEFFTYTPCGSKSLSNFPVTLIHLNLIVSIDIVYYILSYYLGKDMSIKMRIPIYYLHHTGNRVVIDVMGTNVGECMQSLSEQFEGFKQIVADGFYNVYMMDKYSSPVELQESVQDGDELVLVRGGT